MGPVGPTPSPGPQMGFWVLQHAPYTQTPLLSLPTEQDSRKQPALIPSGCPDTSTSPLGTIHGLPQQEAAKQDQSRRDCLQRCLRSLQRSEPKGQPTRAGLGTLVINLVTKLTFKLTRPECEARHCCLPGPISFQRPWAAPSWMSPGPGALPAARRGPGASRRCCSPKLLLRAPRRLDQPNCAVPGRSVCVQQGQGQQMPVLGSPRSLLKCTPNLNSQGSCLTLNCPPH